MDRRDGFTLLEVLIAMVILGIALLGLQASLTDRIVRDLGRQDLRAAAAQIAADRIHAVQTERDYYALESKYESTDSLLPAFPGFLRTTVVAPAPAANQTVVTVKVQTPDRKETVARTVVIGAP